MKKFYFFVFALVFVPVIILIGYSGLKPDDAFSENMINSLSQKLENELNDLLEPVRSELLQIIETYPASSAFSLDEDSLARVFIPVVSKGAAIGSILLYHSEGQSFTVYREKNTFITSLQDPGSDTSGIIWNRRLSDISISSSCPEEEEKKKKPCP